MEVFGLTKAVVSIEVSKIWPNLFLHLHGLPALSEWYCTNFEDAQKVISSLEDPFVIKADEPAAGKELRVVKDFRKAINDLHELIVNAVVGDSG